MYKATLEHAKGRGGWNCAVCQEFGIRVDSDHPGVTMQRALLSYMGREEGKKGGGRQNEAMTIIVSKLKRTSKCFLKLLEVLSRADHAFHTLPQVTETTTPPGAFSLNLTQTPFNKTGAEMPQTSGARQRGDTKCYLSTAKSGNNARNFNMRVSSK